jgi:predicted nucleic acid-binding protein
VGTTAGKSSHRGARHADQRPPIAATALVHGLTVVTRNRVDFEKTGLSIIDPSG